MILAQVGHRIQSLDILELQSPGWAGWWYPFPEGLHAWDLSEKDTGDLQAGLFSWLSNRTCWFLAPCHWGTLTNPCAMWGPELSDPQALPCLTLTQLFWKPSPALSSRCFSLPTSCPSPLFIHNLERKHFSGFTSSSDCRCVGYFLTPERTVGVPRTPGEWMV